MGYTHYWTQPLRYSKAEWTQICEDVTAILNDVQHVQGIPLANGMGELGTQPIIDADTILFNGAGEEDSHEAVHLQRAVPPLTEEDKRWNKQRGWDFCKTARKPYDLAVTAVLAYLAALENKPLSVSSDGDGREWLEGVALARRTVPRLANQIDIPMPIMKDDRWDWRASLGYVKAKHYDVKGCIDGAAYVFDVRDERQCYRFPTWQEANAYFSTFKEKPITVKTSWGTGRSREGGQPLFNTSGSYDARRHRLLEREQTRILQALIDCAAAEGRNIPPPAFARPNEMAKTAKDQPTLADLYTLCEAA
jgi:hypothetical protein